MHDVIDILGGVAIVVVAAAGVEARS